MQQVHAIMSGSNFSPSVRISLPAQLQALCLLSEYSCILVPGAALHGSPKVRASSCSVKHKPAVVLSEKEGK